jgi:hypothetical protein
MDITVPNLRTSYFLMNFFYFLQVEKFQKQCNLDILSLNNVAWNNLLQKFIGYNLAPDVQSEVGTEELI